VTTAVEAQENTESTDNEKAENDVTQVIREASLECVCNNNKNQTSLIFQNTPFFLSWSGLKLSALGYVDR
jgi:hypothetical protein